MLISLQGLVGRTRFLAQLIAQRLRVGSHIKAPFCGPGLDLRQGGFELVLGLPLDEVFVRVGALAEVGNVAEATDRGLTWAAHAVSSHVDSPPDLTLWFHFLGGGSLFICWRQLP